MIQDEIIQLLSADERFHHHGRGNNIGVWATYKKGDEEYEGDIEFKKDLAQKGHGTVRIFLWSEDKQGVAGKIEAYIPSYCEYYTFFEGFWETADDFKAIFRMLGL